MSRASQQSRPPAYVQTSLPILLDLQNRNTREQINTGASRPSASSQKSVAEQSKDECARIMQESGVEFLQKRHLCSGSGPLTREDDVRYFWEWVREFHNEYNDDWYTRNMPRLKQEFYPVWRACVRQETQTNSTAGGTNAMSTATTSAQAAAQGGAIDLLGDINPVPSPSSTLASGARAQARLEGEASPVRPTQSAMDDLLGLETGGTSSTAGSFAPKFSASVASSGEGGLDDLLWLQPQQPPPAVSVAPAATSSPALPPSGGASFDLLAELSSTPVRAQTTLPPTAARGPTTDLLGEPCATSISLGAEIGYAPADSSSIIAPGPIVAASSSGGGGGSSLAEASPTKNKNNLTAMVDDLGDLLSGVSLSPSKANDPANKSSSPGVSRTQSNSPTSPQNMSRGPSKQENSLKLNKIADESDPFAGLLG
ncbi:unnamed protein product [Amoebophrya sp. A25]|nr:unnamed protein product [Amoebophrya sp. A25]|eukprot:GSA25T00002251001.1